MSGSSGSKTRDIGIPSPILVGPNDIIVIRRKLRIPANEFDRSMNELAAELYKQGVDTRFQAAQMIPVIVNKLVVRLFYAVRHMLRYYSNKAKAERSFKAMWSNCELFNNPTVKRMLTIAHGSFCLIDPSDAAIRGFATGAGSFNVVEFCMRINYAGVGRFIISLYGEAKRGIHLKKVQSDVAFAKCEWIIVKDYVEALNQLAEIYGDKSLAQFVNNMTMCELHLKAFQETSLMSEKANVPTEKILKNKADIDHYFIGD